MVAILEKAVGPSQKPGMKTRVGLVIVDEGIRSCGLFWIEEMLELHE